MNLEAYFTNIRVELTKLDRLTKQVCILMALGERERGPLGPEGSWGKGKGPLGLGGSWERGKVTTWPWWLLGKGKGDHLALVALGEGERGPLGPDDCLSLIIDV